jgi:DNA-directed RNA polymerase subunit beta'
MNVLQYFISTHGARKGLADTALKTANSGYLTRRLVDVAQDMIVVELDCGTVDSIEVSALIEGGEIIEPLIDRIVGRFAAEDVTDPFTGEVLVPAHTEIDEDTAQRIEDRGIERVKVRSVLTCESRDGICAMCYGRNLATGQLVEVGEAIGIIAAQSIGEPGTQLTMRTFHIGGTASRVVEQTTQVAKKSGIVRFSNLRVVINKDGDIVVMNRNGSVVILDDIVVNVSAIQLFTAPVSRSRMASRSPQARPSWSGTLIRSLSLPRSVGRQHSRILSKALL